MGETHLPAPGKPKSKTEKATGEEIPPLCSEMTVNE